MSNPQINSTSISAFEPVITQQLLEFITEIKKYGFSQKSLEQQFHLQHGTLTSVVQGYIRVDPVQLREWCEWMEKNQDASTRSRRKTAHEKN